MCYELQKVIFIIFLLPLALFTFLGCKEELYYEPEVSGKIVGKVINYDTKKFESGVLLTLNPSGKSYETDSSGIFNLIVW